MNLLLQTSILLVKSLLRGIIVHRFFGMISMILHVAEMKTESEFPDLYFIWQHGVPFSLRLNNATSEMSEYVRQIHRDLIIVDQ
jgi:hypothetical protein